MELDILLYQIWEGKYETSSQKSDASKSMVEKGYEKKRGKPLGKVQ